MSCEFLRKHRQSGCLIDSWLAVLLYFFQVRVDLFESGHCGAPVMRISLFKLVCA